MILEPTWTHLQKCADSLCSGEIGAFPTETVYGLAGDACNEIAVQRIFEAKSRPTFDPLIVHVSIKVLGSAKNGEWLDCLSALGVIDLKILSESARMTATTLLKNFWPGPFTIVLPKTSKIPDIVTGGLPTVAIRMPRHHVASEFISMTQRPIAAPSANRFGKISPTSALHVEAELGDKIAWILDGGPCEVGIESTVVHVDAVTGAITLLRPGAVTRSAMESLLGQAVTVVDRSPLSPGSLDNHYAPSKPFFRLPSLVRLLNGNDFSRMQRLSVQTGAIALLSIDTPEKKQISALEDSISTKVLLYSLELNKGATTAARNLFAILRAMDKCEAPLLFCEPCPSGEGLLHAIADRLNRASLDLPG